MNELDRIFLEKWKNKKLKNKSFISKKISFLKSFLKKLFISKKKE